MELDHLQVGKIWLLPFLFVFFFISFSCLVTLRIQALCWRKLERVETDFRENAFNFSPFSMMFVGFRFVYTAFIMLRYVPCIPSFFRGFFMKGCWILSKGYFYIYWDNHVVFVLDFIYVLYYTHWFVNVELSFYLWNEINLIMVYDLFNVLLNSVCKYFVEDFCVTVHQEIILYLSFLCVCLYMVLALG
jgi:hypothetical protein